MYIDTRSTTVKGRHLQEKGGTVTVPSTHIVPDFNGKKKRKKQCVLATFTIGVLPRGRMRIEVLRVDRQLISVDYYYLSLTLFLSWC